MNKLLFSSEKIGFIILHKTEGYVREDDYELYNFYFHPNPIDATIFSTDDWDRMHKEILNWDDDDFGNYSFMKVREYCLLETIPD